MTDLSDRFGRILNALQSQGGDPQIARQKMLEMLEMGKSAADAMYEIERQLLPKPPIPERLIFDQEMMNFNRDGSVNNMSNKISYDAGRDVYLTPAGAMDGPMLKNFFLRQIGGNPALWMTGKPGDNRPTFDKSAEALADAQAVIKQMEEVLETIKKEPLICYTIDKLSKDKKYAYVKKGDTDLRINGVEGLEVGDEVLLHPKTFQIVERVGRPPLEASRFSPDAVPNVHWDDIGGLEEAKLDMMEAIELPHKNRELFQYYGQPPIKGVLLSGPPGCGKTMLGKAAANALSRVYGKEGARTGFLYVKGPEILNQYVGQTEQTIRDMFFDAKRHKEQYGYPAVIFLDEADAILATRGTRNVGIGNTIVPMFLTEMDGLEDSGAIVIIATNRPDVLDPAIVRDGRIDRKVSVTRPTQSNAATILRMNLLKTVIAAGNDVDVLAENVAVIMYSNDCAVDRGVYLRDIINGAMLANCVQIATSMAIRRDMLSGERSGVLMEDLQGAVNRIQKQSVGILHDIDLAA